LRAIRIPPDHTESDTRSTRNINWVSSLDGFVTETWRAGVLAGYSHSSFDATERASAGGSDNYHLGIYGGTQWGALGFRTGAAYGWHRIETDRSVAFPGFADSLKGNYDAGTAQLFGELGYRVEMAAASFEPFANLAYVSLHTAGFTEQGGAVALTSASSTTDATFTTLGLRASSGLTLAGIDTTARGMPSATPRPCHPSLLPAPTPSPSPELLLQRTARLSKRASILPSPRPRRSAFPTAASSVRAQPTMAPRQISP